MYSLAIERVGAAAGVGPKRPSFNAGLYQRKIRIRGDLASCSALLGGGRPKIGQTRPLDVQSAPSGGSGMMLRTRREPKPTPRRVRSGFVGKLALEDKQLGTLLIGDDAQVCVGLPAFETHQVREAGLLVERLVSYGWNRARLPSELVGVDNDVAPFPTRKLP